MELFMASACLCGAACRYDATARTDAALRKLYEAGVLIPFCPEVLGGMGVPRPAVMLAGGGGTAVLDGTAQVLTVEGSLNRTEEMLEGARRSLTIAQAVRPSKIFLKSRSPSCGCGPDAPMGVTAALLLRGGFVLETAG